MTDNGKDEYYLDSRVAEDYGMESPGQQGDIEFYADLARKAAIAGHPVLELACGTGRVSIPIARAGIEVVGLDRSPAMLAVAQRESAGMQNVRWVEADMADFQLDQRFGLVFIPYRSFLMLMTVAEQKSCLHAVHRHLVPGGILALNIFNPDLGRLGDWVKSRSPRITRRRSTEANAELWFYQSFRTATQESDELRVVERLDEDNAVVSRVYQKIRLRYIFRYEMEHLLDLCGFEVEALYAWFDRRAFTDESREMVWVARSRV